MVATGVTCRVGRRTVLRNVDLATTDGEVLGIVGPNGSGKSTLLRTLAGLTRPVDGTVTIDGHDLHVLPVRRRARSVSLLTQDEHPDADLTAGDVVALGRMPYLPPWGASDAGAVGDALARVDLAGFADRRITELSGGERRRVLLARALIQDTGLLLLDEPTNHLDVGHSLQVMNLVRSSGRTVVVALHDLSLARTHCDRIVVVHDGTTRPAATAHAALSPDVLAEVFGVKATPVVHPDTGDTHLLITALEENR
ncbi:ABC transporter ATP-binding protein [Rhodococcoides trifolii]|uniref:ABC transporter ATP-binding protein n=1 Tax=Rhodococcoides trifolii TaxID=908250 RepID=A0A917CVR8_9NOCA|nr:ABC transporter ATP-binding protein [Rhodococcus trifolii]